MPADLREILDGHVRDLLAKATQARRALQLFIPFATALVAVLKGTTPASASPALSSGSSVAQIGLLVLVAVAGGVVVWTDRSATTVVHDAQNALNQRDAARGELAEAEAVIDELESALAQSSRVEDIVEAMRAVVDVAICESAISAEKLNEWFVDLLDFLVTDKLTLFGIGDEQWNFSIYVLDGGTGELRCAATRRPTKKEEEAPHRSWAAGEGHVGKAFQGRRPLVCADCTDPNVRGFFDAPAAKLMDYDADRYRSLAALPIQSDEEVPYGVLVATSEVPGRFEPEDDETLRPLLSLARTLATLIAVYNLKAR
jgi:GAF domain